MIIDDADLQGPFQLAVTARGWKHSSRLNINGASSDEYSQKKSTNRKKQGIVFVSPDKVINATEKQSVTNSKPSLESLLYNLEVPSSIAKFIDALCLILVFLKRPTKVGARSRRGSADYLDTHARTVR